MGSLLKQVRVACSVFPCNDACTVNWLNACQVVVCICFRPAVSLRRRSRSGWSGFNRTTFPQETGGRYHNNNKHMRACAQHAVLVANSACSRACNLFL